MISVTDIQIKVHFHKVGIAVACDHLLATLVPNSGRGHLYANITVQLQHINERQWQDIWNCCPGNKLHAIYPVMGTAQHNKIRLRHEAVIINRL